MVKNSREGNRERAARRREALSERGIKQVLLLAPEVAHPLLKQAVGLMTRDDDPMDPRTAMRLIGGANEPDPAQASPELVAELEAARARTEAVEREVERWQAEIEEAGQREQALRAERDAASAAEATERDKTHAATQDAQKRTREASEAIRRAEKAETTIRQAKSLPGLKGRLMRWLAGDVLG
jgi:hypothetical protein